MATKVTFVSGTAEVKRRDRNEPSEGSMESMTHAQPVTYVDGKCTCCPYGYHIDLDFINFCQDVTDGSTLLDLKRIQRAKRNLRKSMEVMLHQQQQQYGDSATASLAQTPPPDVVHSTEASRLINMVQYEQTATHKVLRNIDSSVNATLGSVDSEQQPRGRHPRNRYPSSESDDGHMYSPASVSFQQERGYHTLPSATRRTGHYYHSNGEDSSHFATSLSTTGRTDSMTSLSSVSSVSTEQVMGQYTSHASGMLNSQPRETSTTHVRHHSEIRYAAVSATAMSSDKLAASMETHFPQQGWPADEESPSSPLSPDTPIGKASLSSIRQTMAVSLQRMRELEEQVKAIPILQVRISVLKEEKRLLALQLKAKSNSANVRSIGMGDGSVESPLSPSQQVFFSSSTHSLQASSPRSPATLPKPSRVKTVGVGDHSIVEPYLLQPHLPTGYTITDNQVQTEIRTTVHEKETRFIDGGSLDRRLAGMNRLSAYSHQELLEHQSSPSVQTHFTINQIQRSAPRPMMRSIGIGEGNVHDTSLQIHEKELRTVILGGSGPAVGKRNVGVEVRVPTRSVGVSYSCDDARPATRTVGVNVSYDTSNILTSLDFKGETELRTALRGVLQRNVRSTGTNCDFRPEIREVGVQHESFNMVTVGCGGEDCRTDIDIRLPVSQRTVGMVAKPEMTNCVTSTDKDWVLDQGTNTVGVEMYNKSSNTDSKRLGTVATNTEFIMYRAFATQTEVDVFQRLQALKQVGINTTPVSKANSSSNTMRTITSNRGVNTKAPELETEGFDFQITYDDTAVNTPKEFRDTGVNTSSKELKLSFSKVESTEVVSMTDEMFAQQSAPRPRTMQEHIIQRGASQASAFLGGGSLSSSTSLTSPSGLSSSVSENESVTRTIKETVYISPATSLSTCGRVTGGLDSNISTVQSDLMKSTSGAVLHSHSTIGDAEKLSGNLADSGGSSSFTKNVITRTITTGGLGGEVDSGGRLQVGRDSSTVTGSSGHGTENVFSRGDGNHETTVITKKMFIVNNGDGSRSLDESGVGLGQISSGGQEATTSSSHQMTRTIIGGSGQEGGTSFEGGREVSQITRTITGDRADISSGSSLSDNEGFQKSYITKTFFTSGSTEVDLGADQIDTGFSEGGSTVTRTITSSDVGDFGSGSHAVNQMVTQVIKTSSNSSSTTGDTSHRSEMNFMPFSATNKGIAVEDGRKHVQVHGIVSGGSSYMERFGFTKNTNLSSGVVTELTGGSESSTIDTGGSESSTVKTGGFGSSTVKIGGSESSTVKTGGFGSSTVDIGGSESYTVKTGGFGSSTVKIGGSESSTVKTGGFGSSTVKIGGSESFTVKTGGSESSTMETGGSGSSTMETGGSGSSTVTGEGNIENVSGTSVEVVQGTAILQSSVSESSLQSGPVKLVGGYNVEKSASKTLSSSGSLQSMSSAGDAATEVVIKRSSSSGRLSKHRHSDGARFSRELAMEMQGGAFSGRRVGSVEDFMPDNMRRFMNIETVSRGNKSQSGSGSGKSDMLVTKSTRTVTTKRMGQDGRSTTCVTKTVTNPDGTVTTTSSTDLESVQTVSGGKALSHLSSGQFDLSKIAGEDFSFEANSKNAQELSGSVGMKDSGCYDSSTVSSVSESSSFHGLDLSSMGSLERKQLKSIMKRSKADAVNPKKGISFADNVVGGTGSSTEGTESDDESTTSYDEGSYDGREGDIIYQCQDDEAIARGLPGATMYDQNIRETSLGDADQSVGRYELSEEMRQACGVLANYLVDSTTIQTKELNSNLSVVQEEWFRVSSHKLSSAHQVEDYLSSINEISPRLLDYIVNIVDSNGNAAIHYSVSHSNFDIVGLLLDTEVCDVQRQNKAGYTPAMLASLAHVQNEDYRENIRRLLAAGNVNARAEKTGQTALMLATSQCRADMVQLLLEAGADCNIQDFDGSTALMCASEHGHTAIAQLLLSHPDCDANLTDNESSNALSIAMAAGHKDLGVLLYKHLNFSKPASPGFPKKRKGPSSPTPRHTPR